MDNDTHFEIERKYLIEMPDLTVLKSKALRTVDILQTYLISDGGEIRIRSLFENGNYKYIKTVKKSVTALRRIETESEISREEYLAFLKGGAQKRQLRKTRYILPYKNQIFEIDIYPFWNDKAIMEIELEDEDDKIIFPDFIKVLREVSEEKEYRNFALAKQI